MYIFFDFNPFLYELDTSRPLTLFEFKSFFFLKCRIVILGKVLKEGAKDHKLYLFFITIAR